MTLTPHRISHLTMSLPGSTPLQSFLGGVCAAFPVHALLSFNNNTFGISGFIHGAARGSLEDAMSVLGLVLGGAAVAVIEGDKPTVGDSAPLPLILSGLLVGAGSKVRQISSHIPRRNPDHAQMSNGCTSGWVHFGFLPARRDDFSPPPFATQTYDLRPVTFLHYVRRLSLRNFRVLTINGLPRPDLSPQPRRSLRLPRSPHVSDIARSPL
jgi:hypothetical protein